jgi:aldehyde:ferredoxin oxidoreductase
MYGFKDYRDAVKLIAELDEYGMDMFEFFGVAGLAAKLGEHGSIQGINIALDDLNAMMEWAEKISFRKGLGDVMADGFSGMINAYGDAAKTYAPALVKNMHPYTGPGSALPWDLFGTMELGQILDLRGPHVGSGGSPTYFAKRPLEVFPKHLKRMGVPEAAISRILPESDESKQLNVGILLKYSHQWFSILGSLGVCARGQINRFYSAGLCADFYEAVTGIRTDLDDLRLRADRAWNFYKLLNVREGVDRSRESIPDQWVQAPGFKEYVSETPISRDEILRMIKEYYREQGWNFETGYPSPETLSRLGLESLG